MTPTAALITWLNADEALVAAATAGAWEDPGPPDEDERPFVTVKLIDSQALRCGGGSRHLECLYAVKAVGKAQDLVAVLAARDRLERLLGAADRGLHRSSLAGFDVIGAWTEDAIEYAEAEAVTGIRYEHRGGNYRITVEATA